MLRERDGYAVKNSALVPTLTFEQEKRAYSFIKYLVTFTKWEVSGVKQISSVFKDGQTAAPS